MYKSEFAALSTKTGERLRQGIVQLNLRTQDRPVNHMVQDLDADEGCGNNLQSQRVKDG